MAERDYTDDTSQHFAVLEEVVYSEEGLHALAKFEEFEDLEFEAANMDHNIDPLE